jgi:hypothetical protein
MSCAIPGPSSSLTRLRSPLESPGLFRSLPPRFWNRDGWRHGDTHRGYKRRWLQNKKKNVHVRSFQELDLGFGVAVGTGVPKLLWVGQFSFPSEANYRCYRGMWHLS